MIIIIIIIITTFGFNIFSRLDCQAAQVVQLGGSVVKHKTSTDDLAGLVWCNTQFTMEAVPSPFHYTNTTLNGGSFDAVCITDRLFFDRLWIHDRC